jgi:hypothetical protein
MKKIICSILLACTLSACSYSEGERTGTIVKFSQKGVLFKTWEGELATLAMARAGTAFSNSFAFTVKDDGVVQRIRMAMRKSDKITITYEQQFFMLPWEGDTTYIIKDVNVVSSL